MSEKLLLAIRKRLRDETLVPSDTLKNFLTINGVKESSKMSRRDLEYHVGEAMSLVDFSNYLPQQIPLTESLMKDLLDPLTTVRVPTNMYRVTMRKLLRLTLSQLQEQAKLMKLDALDLDEEGIASLILINMNQETELILPLSRMLLTKEIAFVFGIRLEIPLRGPRHPSSTITFTLKPVDMVQDLDLSRSDILEECINQGISVNRLENKRQLAIRLVVWWTAHPDLVRQPFTENFESYIMEIAKKQR